MTDYVALLRGVAPAFEGMKNRQLAGALGGAGFDVVRTVGSSGNVLFHSDDRSRRRLERSAEEALHGHLGRPCTAIVRSRRQLERLLASVERTYGTASTTRTWRVVERIVGAF